MKSALVLVTILFFGCCSFERDYFWRQFLGKVPGDAVVAGVSLDGTNIYIGQAYVKNAGLIVAQITPGVKEVYAPHFGIQKIDKYIKILCGPPEKFFWMAANYTDLHLQMSDKHAVLGGHEDAYGYMNIGRFSHAGQIIIGKVNSFWPEHAYFYYNGNGTEKRIGSYQILMYKDGTTGIDVRITPE